MRITTRFHVAVAMLASTALTAFATPPAPVTALAYRHDGTRLAAGLRGEVLLLSAASGIVGHIPGQSGPVTALAWSRDGARLAVASGVAGKSGEVRVYAIPASGAISANLEKTIASHSDRIHDLSLSPDGKTLATCGYDRLIKLWDVASGNEIRTLKDHSDAVYGISWRPDGKLLASAAADRAVKVWDVATGTRLYSLGDPTDWVYAVAWHPDGKRLAAAGVDKSIRVWEADEKEGRLVRSAFAHEKAVLRLAYSADGKTLFSVSEDRVVKAWDTDGLTEKRIFAAQPESVLAMALRPDGKQLALGRYDGALVLLDAESGKLVAQPLPEKPKPPKIGKLTPDSGTRGKAVALVFEGESLAGATEVLLTGPDVELQSVSLPDGNRILVKLMLPANAEPGVYQLRLKSAAGQSNPVPFFIDRFAARPEPAGTDSPRIAPELDLQTTAVGTLSRAGEVDYYRLSLKAGKEVGIQVQAAPGGKLEPVLTLEDATGKTLTETTNGSLGFTCEKDGVFVLALRDREYRGGGEFGYRVHVGDIPIVTSYLPLGLQRGTSVVVFMTGVHFSPRFAHVKAPANAVVGSRISVPLKSKLGTVLNSPGLVVGEFPLSAFDEPMKVPGTVSRAIHKPGVVHTWAFPAKKGQPLIVEIDARRLGSALDSMIEILDDGGVPVPWAVLRCMTKTTVAFRDHDSASPGIRMDTWNEFAIDDYVMIGNELMRIRALPRNPDDDCQFYAVNGQRLGYFGTTPSFHAMSSPMFKVGIFPPGSVFPPNGMPVFPLMCRNDDGGPGYGKDSRLRFDPPADGQYWVRVTDARGFGGPEYGYRLTIRPPRPNFSIKFNPTAPSVWKGGAVPVTVTADRFDDFDGPIQVKLDNLPTGFSAPATFIEAGQTSTTFALYADEKATLTDAKRPAMKLVATADIDGKMVTHEAAGGVPKAVDPGDIVTTAAAPTVTIRPGQETRLLVHVDRRNGFKGRIPLDVLGLPHGVRVLNVGLNGILVTERDTAREIFIYAEPWVKPMEHPFVVLAKREGKNTDHAAKSVLLKVEK